MKMCVLPEEKLEIAGIDPQRGEVKSAVIGIRKPRGTSFDGKRSRCFSMDTQKDRSNSDPSPYREEKRTNSDDESESKVGNDARDLSMVTTTTMGLDTLAAMASEAKSIERGREIEDRELAPKVTESQSKSLSNNGVENNAADKADNSKSASLNKPPITKRSKTDINSSRHIPSRQHPSSDMHSPSFERYAPHPHYMQSAPPGYCAPFYPHYPYGHGCYIPSPPRAHPPSPYYHGHYYPRYGPRPPAHPHPYDVPRYHVNEPGVLSERSMSNADQPSRKPRRPSQEGLPLKKRKFQETALEETEPDKNTNGLKIHLGNDTNGDKSDEENPDAMEKREVDESDKMKEQEVSSERPMKMAKKTSEVVTPSPRSIDSRNASSSSASIITSSNDVGNGDKPAILVAPSESLNKVGSNDKANDERKAPEIQSPSPPAVHPCVPQKHSCSGHPPVGHHHHGPPHYPSPIRAAQSLKHQDRSLSSPPHHYPYASHYGAHPYYPHYYPPSHEAAPYWRHPYPYPPSQHQPPHLGSAGSAPMHNHKPVEVGSSTNLDSEKRKIKSSPPGRKNGTGEKADVCMSREPVTSAASACTVESAVGEENVRRCVHIYGPMLVHYAGRRGEPESDMASLPSFYKLVNYPEFLPQKNNHLDGNTLSDDETKVKANPSTKYCVMCGTCCFFVGMNASETKREQAEVSSSYIIPRQNKGLCTACDVKVWLVRDLNLTIKWCKGCKNFRTWSAFGEKSRATKCAKCRDRQKEKYAAQKEAKKKRENDNEKDRGSDSEESGETGRRESKASDDEMDAASGLCNMMNGRI